MIVRRAVPLAVVSLALAVGGLAAARRLVEPARTETRGSGELEPGSSAEARDAVRIAVLAGVNEARRRAGLAELAHNAALALAASGHAADMAARGYFAHESPEGTTARERAEAAGYRNARAVGETIAYGQRSAGEVVAGWLASAPHRRILLDRTVTEGGVGIAIGRQGRSVRITWVALVAQPRPARAR